MSARTPTTTPVIVICVDCDCEVTLPPTEPGYVSVAPLDGWTAPPPRCPACSALARQLGAIRDSEDRALREGPL